MVVTRSNHIHASGILSLSANQCSTNGKSVYCCSSDETFGIWNCSDTGELEVDIQNTANKCQGVLAVYGEDVYLAESSQDVITGVDRQIVVKYGLSAFLPSHPLLTFSLEITALACNGKYLIAGSNDFMVKCLKLPEEWDIESPTVDRYEYDGVVLSISISPVEGEYFSVSTADGYVQIRPTLKTSQSAKKSIVKFKVCDQFSYIRTESPRIECVWQPNGKHLYMPSKGCIIAVECATWEKKRTITNPEIGIETFSVLAITSSDGNDFFMAASTIQGSIVVWKQNGAGTQFQLLSIHKKIQQNIGIITSIVFNPQNDDILIAAYSEGYLCSMTGAKQAEQIYGETTQNEFVESSNPLIDGEAIDDQNDDIDDLETDLGLIKSRFGFDRDGFNQQLGTSNYPPVTNYALQTPAEPCVTIKGMGIPKIFSVGATPSCEEGKYLVWNSYGVIKSYKSEEECTIEINFHDSTIHHEIIMDNAATNYSIGDINADFIALASKRNSSKESELYIHHVTSWDHESRKWTQQMDQGEIIECLTLGHQFIAIYTNLRYLRIFTPSGTQRFVISLPGSFLTMCANGSKLATAYSTGGVLVESEDDYEHQIMLTQYEINALAGECSPRAEWNVPLAISPYSKPIWVQFSSAGNLVTMDDDCIVRLYLRQKRVWIPVVSGVKHLKDSETDFLWPISLSELPRAQFRFIYCRNCKYPPINKTLPPITSVPIEIPTINPSVERSKLEAELMTNELQQIIARDEYLHPNQAKEMAQLTQNYVANLLKLFSISCQSNRESRAAEIAHRATNSKIVQGLCNYAAKVQRPNLSEKVAAIGRERIARDRMETNEQMQKKREQEIGGKQKPLGMINSDLARNNPNEEPIIAPSKILMAKRKIPNLGSMMPPKNTKLINKNQPNPFAKQIREKENGNNEFGKEMDHQMEEEEEGEGDDVSSIGGGESELDSSICSSLFPTSIPMDLSSANNPFKKAKMTSASSIVSTSTYKNRGFAEKEDDNESIVDFFDDLTSSGKDKN